ncbi:RNA-dependent DNA polymerase, partial [Terribacillus saccharophilus]
MQKKSGGERIIHTPSIDLKEIQRSIVEVLWRQQKILWEEHNIKPNISHAFIKKKGIITNARVHKNKRYVFNIDLEDFFDSFHFGRVRGFFEKNKDFLFPEKMATTLAQLTCYNGSLPQGAPTSPIITNLICNILDMRLLKIAKEFKLDYTRY